MINKGSLLRNTISCAAIFSATAFIPTTADAARCFGKETAALKAGNATAVRGPDVGLKKKDGADFARPSAGADLYGGDRVRTGDDSILQVKLCDWSTYTFSPGSESDINEFYSTDGAQKRRVVNFLRGGMRLLSGKDGDKDDTEVKFEEAGVTMGVRGTGVVIVELDGLIYVLLEGPGVDNSGLAEPGKVDFTDDEKQQIIAKLYRQGFAVTVGPDGVSEPFMPDADLLRRIYAAFTPTAPGGDEPDSAPQFGEKSAEEESGQGTQEGGQGVETAQNDTDSEEDDTQFQPPPVTPPTGPMQGDILTIPQLDTFGSMFAAPSGHFLALGPAQLFSSVSGQPRQLASDGIALMQMHVDFSTRTVAPEAALSFTIFDFSVTNPNDLSIDNPNPPIGVGGDITEDAYTAAQLTNVNASFDSGLAGFANFMLPMYTLTLRQGAQPNEITLDADIAFVGPDDGGVVVSADATFQDLLIIPGDGDLVFFDSDDIEFANMFTIAELDAFAASGQAVLSGIEDIAVTTLGNPAVVPGFTFSEFVVDFDNRTIGGPGSFIFITATVGGVLKNVLVPFDQAIPWSSGLFNMAFIPLAGATNDPNFIAGEFAAALVDACCFAAMVAVILDAGGGDHLYGTIDNFTDVRGGANPLSSIGALDSFGAVTATFHYDGQLQPGGAEFTNALGVTAFGFAFASIDFNFGNRTIGGGTSFVAVDIDSPSQNIFVQFAEGVNAISFDDAAGGAGIFGLGDGDFDGANINAALLTLRNGPADADVALQLGVAPGSTIPGGVAELVFTFTDAGSGSGFGSISMPLLDNPTPSP